LDLLRDSKTLTTRARLVLAERIGAVAIWTRVEVRSAAVVDRYVRHPRKTLNHLEREMAAPAGHGARGHPDHRGRGEAIRGPGRPEAWARGD